MWGGLSPRPPCVVAGVTKQQKFEFDAKIAPTCIPKLWQNQTPGNTVDNPRTFPLIPKVVQECKRLGYEIKS